jgi:hypothetical protein
VTTTATDFGRARVRDVRTALAAPAGWDVRATSPRRTDRLKHDQSLATSWQLSIPADVQPGTYDLTVKVHYRARSRRGLTAREQYSVYVPPPPPPPFAAWYTFDDGSGTSAADASGNGNTAQLHGGAGWTTGKLGGAVSLDGVNGYVSLPPAVITGATSYSVAAWVKLDALSTWSRIFDLGNGTDAYMFLTPRSGSNTLRFAITVSGSGGEQQINAPPLTTGAWTHVAVTYGDGVGILYVNGQEVARNGSMTVTPQMFGTSVRRNYIGRSQYADPYLKGVVDDFRVYGRTLTAAEVAGLAAAPG